MRSHGPEPKVDPRCLPPTIRSDLQRNYFNHQLNVKERERGMIVDELTYRITFHLVGFLLEVSKSL